MILNNHNHNNNNNIVDTDCEHGCVCIVSIFLNYDQDWYQRQHWPYNFNGDTMIVFHPNI